MNIGVIYCGYNNLDLTKQSLPIWIEASKLYSFKIAAVSVPFFEYKNISVENDGTTDYIKQFSKNNLIDICFDNPKYVKEADARNLCLFYLLSKDCDYIFLADSDEIYTIEQIGSILQHVKENSDIECFEIQFKNYIFDGKQWIDGFHPYRIFKTNCHGGLKYFYWDNDTKYADGTTHLQVKRQIIPKEVSFVRHMTWLHSNGKQKYEYQMKHFGLCSYKWNYEKNQLEFNSDYYKNKNEQIPKINYDIK
jgi:hypothetical protein